MIKDAMAISKEGFNIISSPWTAPPWMKDNNAWVGGKLLPEYYCYIGPIFFEISEGIQSRGYRYLGSYARKRAAW